MRNAAGLVVAGAVALALSGARVAGIDAWKIVLAGVGLLFFVMSGRGSTPSQPKT